MSRADVTANVRPRRRLSNGEARRIALAAQGFDRPRPETPVNAGHIRRVIERLGLLQLDFVNVLVPAHRLVPYSRLGACPADAFQRAVYGSGTFIEQWAHEASIVPVDHWPLLAHRRRAFEPSPRSPVFKIRNWKRYLEEVIEIVRKNGAVTSNDLPSVPGPKRRPGDWHRSVPRWALEHHFGHGRLAVSNRLANFQRVYDLPERVIPVAQRERRVDDDDAQRCLLDRAARALGIATSRDLADYYRMNLRTAVPRLAELREQGRIRAVTVDGWDETAWLAAGARLPRRIECRALLSPFDPLVWYRPRAMRLFDFHYRIEIYVPAHRRRWGYYVLPFLCGDRLRARVDLKAERTARVLHVRAAHAEPGAAVRDVAGELARELCALADWLELETMVVERRGDLAAMLRRALPARMRA